MLEIGLKPKGFLDLDPVVIAAIILAELLLVLLLTPLPPISKSKLLFIILLSSNVICTPFFLSFSLIFSNVVRLEPYISYTSLYPLKYFRSSLDFNKLVNT
jgi:hypothetical protein